MPQYLLSVYQPEDAVPDGEPLTRATANVDHGRPDAHSSTPPGRANLAGSAFAGGRLVNRYPETGSRDPD